MKFWILLLVTALAGFGLGTAIVFLFWSLGAPAWTALFVTISVGYYLGRCIGKSVVFD